ncbi:hypothetical protein HII36_22710 [Nonomuraea sp. NN258]|uniref:hypothetical protein n=1 Tax=Nonomuraea antri TaxID=2730852 RepID=UPI001568BABB|nr:hypothetical protein [Nonomuraea antri]NRQ34626.1 hypothetical protein [Nonomuraea antri]
MDERPPAGRIFRAEALRRRAAQPEPPRSSVPGARGFAILWAVVAVLAAVLALLAWPLLGGGR